MKLKRTLISAILALTCCVTASAQEAKVENVFSPHWYIQLQGGAQYTLGEIEFSELLSPTAQVGLGYNFTPVLGARLAVNAWQSKAGSEIQNKTYKWKWNYVSPNVDLTLNLSNLLCGYNPNRIFTVGLFGGIGANVGFKNDEAAVASKAMLKNYAYSITADDQFLHYLWDGTKVRLNAQFCVNLDLRLSKRVSLGVEAQANTLSDNYNSKKAGNSDWHFNGLVGLKINLGQTHTVREVQPCEPKIVYQDRVVEKIVEKPVVAPKAEKEPLHETMFYEIRLSDVESYGVIEKIVAWCNKYPTQSITIDGYADKGTGNAKLNEMYARKRAEKVADALKARGISVDRMIVTSHGDKVQPFSENAKNRCVIVVGE